MSNIPKPKIIHIIDSLTHGGAEILLKNSINLLSQYDHLIIYLHGPEDLKKQFNANAEFECIGHRRWSMIFKSCIKVKKIIAQKKPLLVHSHLQTSTLIARYAVPANIPLVSTIHSMYSIDAFQKHKKRWFAEKISIRKRHSLIAVSRFVLKDYLEWIPFKGKAFVLYNFLPNDFFVNNINGRNDQNFLKCVAIGNLKEAKNYPYLLKIFSHLKNQNITLDIYGQGHLKKKLLNIIEKENLPVKLAGHAADIKNILPHYDLFIQASEHEGFGLSVIEAIAAKLPVFISDIPVFKEVTDNHAYFFPLDNDEEAADRLKRICEYRHRLYQYVERAYEYSYLHFSEEAYEKKLLDIYNDIAFNQTC